MWPSGHMISVMVKKIQDGCLSVPWCGEELLALYAIFLPKVRKITVKQSNTIEATHLAVHFAKETAL